jgi:hypothetical protein
MITIEYLNALYLDMQNQLAEHERNIAACRGALQVLEHLMQKITEGSIVEPSVSPIDGEKNKPDVN